MAIFLFSIYHFPLNVCDPMVFNLIVSLNNLHTWKNTQKTYFLDSRLSVHCRWICLYSKHNVSSHCTTRVNVRNSREQMVLNGVYLWSWFWLFGSFSLLSRTNSVSAGIKVKPHKKTRDIIFISLKFQRTDIIKKKNNVIVFTLTDGGQEWACVGGMLLFHIS